MLYARNLRQHRTKYKTPITTYGIQLDKIVDCTADCTMSSQ